MKSHGNSPLQWMQENKAKQCSPSWNREATTTKNIIIKIASRGFESFRWHRAGAKQCRAHFCPMFLVVTASKHIPQHMRHVHRIYLEFFHIFQMCFVCIAYSMSHMENMKNKEIFILLFSMYHHRWMVLRTTPYEDVWCEFDAILYVRAIFENEPKI